MKRQTSKTETRKILQAVGEELRDNPPRQLQATLRMYGPMRARRQFRAILLSKARAMGARLPNVRKSASLRKTARRKRSARS